MERGTASEESVRAELARQGVPFSPEAFLAAVENGELERLRALLQAGMSVAEVRAAAGHDPLFAAVRGSELGVIAILIDNGADAAATNDAGLTPLLAAVVARRSDLIPVLLACGADANATAPDGRTALMLAAADDQPVIVASLIEGGARIAAADAEGADALVHAIRCRAVAAVSALVRGGADREAPRGEAGTPEELAKRLRLPDVLKALQENQAEIAQARPHGHQPPVRYDESASFLRRRSAADVRPLTVAMALALGGALAAATAALVWSMSTRVLLDDPRLRPAEVARRSLAAAVDEIEAFRAEQGRLPASAAEASLDDWHGIVYTVDPAGSSYEVTMRVEGATVSHHGGPAAGGGR